MLSYDRDRLLETSKRKEVECVLKLNQPLRLDRLSSILEAIHVEFGSYKVTKASIPPWVSLPISTSVLYANTLYRGTAGQWHPSFLSYYKLKAEGRTSMANFVPLIGRPNYAKECGTGIHLHSVQRCQILHRGTFSAEMIMLRRFRMPQAPKRCSELMLVSGTFPLYQDTVFGTQALLIIKWNPPPQMRQMRTMVMDMGTGSTAKEMGMTVKAMGMTVKAMGMMVKAMGMMAKAMGTIVKAMGTIAKAMRCL